MTLLDLHEAICRALATLWPDRTIYPDVCPDDHDRPSAYVKDVESVPRLVNPCMVQWNAKLLIVLWQELDDYGLADSERLMADQIAVISTLMAAPLAVKDRRILVAAKDAGQDPADGAAFVEVTVEWYGPLVDLKESPDNVSPSLMEEFHARFERDVI